MINPAITLLTSMAKAHKTSHLAEVVAASLIMGAGSALAYDVAADFSTNSNPNGVWTYGYSLTLGGTLIPYTDHGTFTGNLNGVGYWRNNISGGAPVDTHNYSANNLTNNTGLATEVLLAGTSTFHPGPQDQYSVFRFTAPTTGQYQLNASFWGTVESGTTTDVHILDNGVGIYSVEITGFMNFTGPSTTVLSLTTGDHIDFEVGYGTDGDFTSDGTGISAQLNPVPEPSTLALAGLGVAALMLSQRKGRNC
jgi:hypothetical protein